MQQLFRNLFPNLLINEKEKFHFLIVDDSKLDITITEKIVKNIRQHYSINCFLSGEELMDYLKLCLYKDEHKIILFIDIHMPIINGIDTVEYLTKVLDRDVRDRMFIYFLSSSMHQEDYERVKNLSTKYHYILKPINQETMDNILKNIYNQVK